MKKSFLLLFVICTQFAFSQTTDPLVKHYEGFYKQMRVQGDITGVINALTHLNVLNPTQARKDTLAYIYMNNNQHLQALNTIGVESNPDDSDLAIQVKAVSLKSLNQPKMALEKFELLFQRQPSAYLAYELADLKIMTGDNSGAAGNIEFGITNSKEDMKHAFFERQQPYEVPLKAAFFHLKGLMEYNVNKANIDGAIGYIEKALELDPNFNLASLSKQALESRKEEDGKQD